MNHTMISCVAPPGNGSGLSVTVTVAQQEGFRNSYITYGFGMPSFCFSLLFVVVDVIVVFYI